MIDLSKNTWFAVGGGAPYVCTPLSFGALPLHTLKQHVGHIPLREVAGVLFSSAPYGASLDEILTLE